MSHAVRLSYLRVVPMDSHHVSGQNSGKGRGFTDWPDLILNFKKLMEWKIRKWNLIMMNDFILTKKPNVKAGFDKGADAADAVRKKLSLVAISLQFNARGNFNSYFKKPTLC